MNQAIAWPPDHLKLSSLKASIFYWHFRWSGGSGGKSGLRRAQCRV